jgi:Transposase domain (DUF772)
LRRGHDLSDGRLAEARADRASFRRFCGFARDAATPGRTALVRFRLLAGQGLGRTLFEAIAGDLERKGATVRQGAPIDAGPASKGDKQAAWAKPKSRAPAHGYKAHIAADKDRGIVRATEPTPANEADVALAPALIPNPPGEENSASGILGGEVYGDQADDALSVERAIAAAGGTSKIWRNGHRWLAAEKLAAGSSPAAPDPVPSRENFCNVETNLPLPAHAMARARQSQTASPSRGHRLQHQPLPAAESRVSEAQNPARAPPASHDRGSRCRSCGPRSSKSPFSAGPGAPPHLRRGRSRPAPKSRFTGNILLRLGRKTLQARQGLCSG